MYPVCFFYAASIYFYNILIKYFVQLTSFKFGLVYLIASPLLRGYSKTKFDSFISKCLIIIKIIYDFNMSMQSFFFFFFFLNHTFLKILL